MEKMRKFDVILVVSIFLRLFVFNMELKDLSASPELVSPMTSIRRSKKVKLLPVNSTNPTFEIIFLFDDYYLFVFYVYTYI